MPSLVKALDVAWSERGLHYRYPTKKPFECRIPGGLTDGRKIYVNGMVPPDSQRFAINLETGSNIAFHLNPRFDESDIVMNSRISDEWGSEQRIGKMPLRHMSGFLICITTLQQGYEVEINDTWAAVFEHRIPYDQVTNLTIDGDVDIIGVHIHNDDVAKGNMITIPDGGERDLSYTVVGECNSDFSGFSLNLQCGDSDNDDIALHFNPRGDGTNQVIRNSFIDGSWGEEEREGDFPFTPGERFKVTITTLVDGFKVLVNGEPFTYFMHRHPTSKICRFNAQGDVKIRNINIELPSSLSYPTSYIKEDLIEPATPAKVAVDEFKPGSKLTVTGIINSEPSRFKINFQSGGGEDDDVLLHINPRWDQGDPIMVLNSREGGDWGEEQLWAGDFPLQAGSAFEINVECKEREFVIQMNGGYEQSFTHRSDYNRISHVIVDGCVQIKRIIIS